MWRLVKLRMGFQIQITHLNETCRLSKIGKFEMEVWKKAQTDTSKHETWAHATFDFLSIPLYTLFPSFPFPFSLSSPPPKKKNEINK